MALNLKTAVTDKTYLREALKAVGSED